MNCTRCFFSIVLLAFVMLVWTLFISCKTKDKDPKHSKEMNDIIARGEILARDYCQRCHLFPSPELLDKKTWLESTLPNMAWRLGIRENGSDPYANMPPEEEKVARKLEVYPDADLIPPSDWAAIKKYYELRSPTTPLPQPKQDSPPVLLNRFTPKLISFDNNPLPQTTLLKFDSRRSQLFAGDAKKNLYILNSKFELQDSWVTDSAPTDIDFPNNGKPRLLTIGEFNPSEQKTGRLSTMDTASILPEDGVFIESLPRPVQFAVGDLNDDGKDDVVICGFGNHTGKLSWYDGMDSGKENILKAMPGARCVTIRDMNKDNKPDIVVLMAQAYEQVSIFYNEGKGKFTEKKVLEFPPVYGVISFELVDFNKDGYQDILLTNGDNWDFSNTRKNYHGIRIYLNDGINQFSEKWFYPMFGACKAIARDFDKDGDLDIAAIAFFSDDEKPEHSFIYLSSNRNLDFSSYTLPQAALGKWLTMEAGDFDRDGDIDLVLGSYFQNLSELSKLVAKGATVMPQLLILTNKK